VNVTPAKATLLVAGGRDVGFTLIAWQLTTSVYVGDDPVQPLESVTVTTIGNVPDCVGVPESTPAVERPKPVGSVLAVVNVAVPTAPLCKKLWLNGVPTVPVVVAGFVTVIVWQLIVRVYVEPVPVQPLASVTVTTIGNVPVCCGVPERTPAVESDKPVGSVLAVVNVAVPIALDCVKVWLKGEPTVPVFVAGFVTVIVWQPTTRVYVAPVP
jgi:hypothetical protein